MAKTIAKELLYAERMTEWKNEIAWCVHWRPTGTVASTLGGGDLQSLMDKKGCHLHANWKTITQNWPARFSPWLSSTIHWRVQLCLLKKELRKIRNEIDEDIICPVKSLFEYIIWAILPNPAHRWQGDWHLQKDIEEDDPCGQYPLMVAIPVWRSGRDFDWV